MPAFASWFRVHPRVVLRQADATAEALADPDHAAARLDLRVVGLDGAEALRTLNLLRHDLRDHLDWQAQASARLTAVQSERTEAAQAFFFWRSRLFARLRLAARRGADPERSFSRTFGFRTLPRPRAAGLVQAGPVLFAALDARQASLHPHGIDPSFVSEGRLLHGRLVSLHEEHAETLSERKAATQAVHGAALRIQQELLVLVAADDAAALDAGRDPAFPLAVLRPPT